MLANRIWLENVYEGYARHLGNMAWRGRMANQLSPGAMAFAVSGLDC
jgi:hypothetical protein